MLRYYDGCQRGAPAAIIDIITPLRHEILRHYIAILRYIRCIDATLLPLLRP